MRTTSKVAVVLVLLLVIAGLAAADAVWREKSLTGQLSLWLSGDDSGSSVPMEEEGQTSSAPVVNTDEDRRAVLALFTERGFTFTESTEKSFLQQLLPTASMLSYTLLSGEDRAGAVVWTATDDATATFQALKESLLQSFSPALQDLKDETVAEPGKPVRSVLTFLDTALSEERLVFVKSGDTLIELHVAPGKEDLVYPLLEELSAAVGS